MERPRSATLPPGPVLKYYLYRSTTNVGFAVPVFVLFVLSRDLSYTEVGLLETVWWVAIVAGELPTGYVGDRVGWRTSLLLSAGLITVSVALFGLSGSVVAFVAVRGLWAVGTTFRSGSVDAWLYETLIHRVDSADEEDFARVRGRGDTVALAVTAVTAVLGGYLAEVDLAYPFFATAAVTGFGFLVLLTFPRSPQFASDLDPDDTYDADDFSVSDAVETIRYVAATPALRYFILYVGLFFGVVEAVNLWIQPIGVDVGLTNSDLGLLYAAFSLTAGGLTYFSGPLKERVGVKAWFYVVPPTVGILLAAVVAIPPTAVGVFLVMTATKLGSRPLMGQYLNDRGASEGRSTLLSTASIAISLLSVPFYLASGLLADVVGPVTAVGAFGGLLVVGAVGALAVGEPVATDGTEASTGQSAST